MSQAPRRGAVARAGAGASDSGATLTKVYEVAPNARLTVWADGEVFDGIAGRPLEAVDVSTTFDVLNDVPIAVERGMRWPGPTAATWTEAHASPGALAPATRWAVAAGQSERRLPCAPDDWCFATPGQPQPEIATYYFQVAPTPEDRPRVVPACLPAGAHGCRGLLRAACVDSRGPTCLRSHRPVPSGLLPDIAEGQHGRTARRGVTLRLPPAIEDTSNGASCPSCNSHRDVSSWTASPRSGDTAGSQRRIRREDATNAAGGDPDGDGITNAAELLAGTHPTGLPSATRYLAEGATGPMFDAWIAIANPGSEPAIVLLRFLGQDDWIRAVVLDVPPLSIRRVHVNEIPGLGAAGAFSTVIEANVPVVAEREMAWDRTWWYGSHADAAIESPAATWYFAEGANLLTRPSLKLRVGGSE